MYAQIQITIFLLHEAITKVMVSCDYIRNASYE